MRIYLRRIFSSSKEIVLSSLIFILVIGLTVLFSKDIIFMEEYLQYIDNKKVDTIAFGSNFSSDTSTYGFYDKTITFHTEKTKDSVVKGLIPAIVLQELNEVDYIDSLITHNKTLGSNEVAISSRLAYNYDIKAGDSLYSILNYEVIEYTVAYIYQELFEVYEVDYFVDTGSILIGSDAEIETTNMSYLYLLETSNEGYKDVYFVSDLVQRVNISILELCIVYSSILLVPFFLIDKHLISNRVVRLQSVQIRGVSNIKLMTFIDNSSYTLIILLLYTLFLVLFRTSYSLFYVTIILLVLRMLITTLITLKGIKGER